MTAPDYDPVRDGPPHPFEPSGTYDARREVCAECGMDRAADEHRPPLRKGRRMNEPGEDACLECSHPDHGKAECGALMGTFHGDDGTTDDDLCDCRAVRVYDLGGVVVSGAIYISNQSGEDEEVIPWPF